MGRTKQKGCMEPAMDSGEVPGNLLSHPGNPFASEYRSNTANREIQFVVLAIVNEAGVWDTGKGGY